MVHRVLIIGCGAIAGGYDAGRSPAQWPLSHAGAIARDARFELVACVDPDEDARTAFAARWRVPFDARSLEELRRLADPIDLIVIASPTRCHAEHLEWALGRSPKAVFCEKPLAQDYTDAARITRAFAERRIPLALNHTRRWQPDVNDLVERTRGGEAWGALLSAVGTYSKGIVHNGSHMVDLLMMFAGPLDLCCAGPARIDHSADDPTVDAILTADHGRAPIHLVGSDARAVTQFELVLNYTQGEIAIRDGGLRIETRRIEASRVFAGYRQLGAPMQVQGRYEEAMAAAYDDLARVIERGIKPRWSQENGIAAQALCEAIRREALQTLREEPRQ